MSRANFGKLVRNIERTGRYEPLVVRPCPGRRGFFQIVNGHHRCEALRQLGHKTVEAAVWNIDDEQTDILLATLNRLGGRDTLDKKLALLQRLSATMTIRKLATLLPQTRGQLERLVTSKSPVRPTQRTRDPFAIPMVFFMNRAQEHAIEEALARAAAGLPDGQTRAARRAAALAHTARRFLNQDEPQAAVEDAIAKPAGTATA
jgi:hypothetical protein